jgi:hypothetical protein
MEWLGFKMIGSGELEQFSKALFTSLHDEISTQVKLAVWFLVHFEYVHEDEALG